MTSTSTPSTSGAFCAIMAFISPSVNSSGKEPMNTLVELVPMVRIDTSRPLQGFKASIWASSLAISACWSVMRLPRALILPAVFVSSGALWAVSSYSLTPMLFLPSSMESMGFLKEA